MKRVGWLLTQPFSTCYLQEAVGPNGFLVGSKLTYADILVYT